MQASSESQFRVVNHFLHHFHARQGDPPNMACVLLSKMIVSPHADSTSMKFSQLISIMRFTFDIHSTSTVFRSSIQLYPGNDIRFIRVFKVTALVHSDTATSTRNSSSLRVCLRLVSLFLDVGRLYKHASPSCLLSQETRLLFLFLPLQLELELELA